MGRKKYQAPYEEPVTYYRIRKANLAKKRQSFAVTAHIKINGRVKSSTVKSEEVDIINRHFKEGLYDFDMALEKCKVVLNHLYKKRDDAIPNPDFNGINMKALKRYWDENYADRDIVDSKGFWLDLKSSMEALGSLSIIVDSKEDLQRELNERWGHNPTKQRRCVSRLNPVLKSLGRSFSFRKMRKVKAPLQYLTFDEFEKAVKHLNNADFKTLCWVAFTTGLRIGEIFALQQSDRKELMLNVSSQLYRDLSRRETKTRQERRAYIIDAGQKHVDVWLNMDMGRRNALRNMKHADVFKRACCKVFSNPEKYCRFHDLRHSYAVMLLQKGVPIGQVAQSLGNSVIVCERYYTGFVLSDGGVDLIHSIMKK